MANVRTAARALILRDGEMLVACYRDAQGEWFTLPGGGQRHGEELSTTVVRECLEETGMYVRPGALRFVREVIASRHPSSGLPQDFHQVEHVFECEITATPPSDAVDPDPNQTGCRWIAIAALRDERFFPRALLDALDSRSVVYLAASP